MIRNFKILFGIFISALLLSSCAPLKDTTPLRPLWISAYYAGWMQGCGTAGHLSPQEIDYSAVTHILHFSVLPNSDGSVDYSKKCISPENSHELTRTAHNAGGKVLISVGGWLSESKFLEATNEANRLKFITNLLHFMTSRGYDGIDIDWEPLSSTSIHQYRTFIMELRNSLNTISPHPILTAAVKKEPTLFASLQEHFDQINIMTYALSGPRQNWIVWHNAPLYDGGTRFPISGIRVPSIHKLVDDFIAAGVKKEKLGIGIPFFGFVWSGGKGTSSGGVTAPGQTWETAPSAEEIPYYLIMEKYYRSELYKWDSAAKAAYLSIDNSNSVNDNFISYDDGKSIKEKIRYVKNKGLGGVMIFELGGGWRPNADLHDGLLQTLKNTIYNKKK